MQTINFIFSDKHKEYIRNCLTHEINVAEGAVRAGKTVDNVFAFAYLLDRVKDKIHLATGSTSSNAKLNIGECNGLGLEHQFRGRCKWTKFKGNECLQIKTKKGIKYVIFAGGAKADSFKKIRGNSYGMWIGTEINLHHDNTIKEAFNRQLAAIDRKIFWDLNPENPQAPIYVNYLDKYQNNKSMSYNYRHFTIFDNITITDERKQDIINQYDQSSIWYKRDILGQRIACEGAIYQLFINNKDRFIIDELTDPLMFCHVGVDFGGNKSANTFQLTGFTSGFEKIITLDEYYSKEQLTPEQFADEFVNFIKRNLAKGYKVTDIFMDSAEQMLIRGLKNALVKAGIFITVKNALKSSINERIKFYCMMFDNNKYFIMRHCHHTIDAFNNALWDDKSLEDKRLDNGIINIDTLDAQEYSTELYHKKIVNSLINVRR